MPEESIDEFLNKVTAKRKTLTDLEKREAMQAAWEVRDIAKRKMPEGKKFAILINKKETGRSTIYVDIPPTSEAKPPWAPKDSNLHIDVLRSVENAMGRIVHVGFDSYYISSSDVIKETVIYPPDELEEDHFSDKHIPREPFSTKRARLLREQSTQEIYHPDKTDLVALLQNLSSAKPFRS